jgi:hypothetical protein
VSGSSGDSSSGSSDPFGEQGDSGSGDSSAEGGESGGSNDPGGSEPSGSGDPFGEGGSQGGSSDPFAEGGEQGGSSDPFGEGGDSSGGGDGSSSDGLVAGRAGGNGGSADAGGDWPDDGSGGLGGTSEQASAFERALEEFDQQMSQEQEAIARTGVGSAADRAFEGAGGNTDEVFGLPDQGGAVGANGGTQPPGTAPPMPGGGNDEPAINVEGCEDSDKVARQLCEAATDEKDPFLRAALWNEYNEYRKILARQ